MIFEIRFSWKWSSCTIWLILTFSDGYDILWKFGQQWSQMQELKCDHCLKCAEPTEHGYVFCEKCTPRYGQTTRIFSDKLQKELTLYVGTFPTGSVIKDRLQGRLPVKWWLGTDALTMWFKPPGKRLTLVILHRIKMLLLEPLLTSTGLPDHAS